MADKACPDCGTIFPLRTAEGVCPLCVQINSYPLGSLERQEAATFHQCFICGVFRKRGMSTTSPDSVNRLCGSLKCNEWHSSVDVADGSNDNPGGSASAAASFPAPAANEHQYQQLVRNDKLRTRMHRGLHTAKSAPNLQIIGSSQNTASLKALQAGLRPPSEPQCVIGYQVRYKRKVNTDLGAVVKAYPLSMFLGEVKEQIVGQINLEWVRLGTGQEPYLVEEVSFRWSGNRNLDANTTSLTLRDFINHYNHSSSGSINAAIGIDHCPTIFKSSVKSYKNMPMMFFEMLLSHEALEQRIAAATGAHYSPSSFLQGALKSIAKRPRNTSSADIESSKIKQRNTNLMPPSKFTSMWRPSARQQHIETRTASGVTLSRTIAVPDEKTNECSLLTANESVIGLLSDKPLAHGSMKLAFELVVTGDDKRYVAKRFFKSEASDDDITGIDAIALLYVSPELHATLISEELYRLTEAAWFLKEFYRYCKTEHPQALVDRKIQIVTAYIGKETNIVPSISSGLSQHYTGPGMTWLIEERRSSAVTKFTGTLDHAGTRQDLVSSTVYAFAHFVLWNSGGTQVYADIQGTTHNVNGVDTMMLFDIMSHTRNGESGVGDHGEDGIQSFIQTHQCSSVCEALQLDQHQTLAKGKEAVYDGAGEKSKKKKRKVKDREEGQVTESSEEEEEEEE